MHLLLMYLPPEQEGHGPDGASPEEATKLIRGMEQLSCKDRLRVILPGEEQALGSPYCSLPVPKRATRRWERDFSQGCGVRQHGETALN